MTACALGLFWLWRSRQALFASPLPPNSRAALAGLFSGAAACLLCNDSGVTAAAMTLLYGWAWASLPCLIPLNTPDPR